MRGTALAFNRFLALLLSFILGFLSFAGVLVGAGYVVYAHLSIDTLNKFGAGINTEEFIDPEAEKSLNKLTIKDLVEEIGYLSAMGEEVDLDTLIERYGLIISEENMKFLSEDLRKLPLAKVFGPDGATVVLSTVKVSDALELIPPELLTISEPMLESLSDNTLADIVEMKLGYLFEGVELGYVLGCNYVKNDETGEYEIVYEVEDDPTFLELLARLDLGNVLTSVEEGNLDLVSVVKDNFGELTIIMVVESLSDDENALPGFLADATFDELIVENEDGSFTIDFGVVLAEAKLGEILAYHYDEESGKWYEDETLETPVEGIYANLCDLPVIDLLDPPADENGNAQTQVDVLIGALGGTLGELMGYYEEDGKWYVDDGTVGDDRTEADPLFSALCGIEISDLMNSEDPAGILTDAFEKNNTTLGDIMGYTYVDETDDGVDNGVWQTESGEEADALFAALCGVSIGELMNSDNASDVVMDAFNQSGTTLGDIMGYIYVDETEDGIDNGVWQTESGEEADALFAALCGVGIYELMNSDNASDVIMGAFEEEGTTLGDIMGYIYVDETDDGIDNGVWQTESGEEADALFTALCGVGIYELMNSDNASDVIMGAFEDEGTTLGDIMGYIYVDETDDGIDNGVWQTESGEESDALFAALCGVSLYELMNSDNASDVIMGAFEEEGTTLGDIMGYVYFDETDDGIDNGVWQTESGEEADALFAALCGVSLYELMNSDNASDVIMDAFNNEGTTLGDLMGYYEEDGVWYVGEGEDKKEADALFGALCGITLYELMESEDASEVINNAFDENNVLLGDVMGYDKVPNPGYALDPENESEYLWYDEEGNEITGISAEIAEYKLTAIMNGELDTDEIMNDVTLAEIYGLEEAEKLPVYLEGVLLGEDAPDIPRWVYTDDGTSADAIIATLAPLTINEIDDALDELHIADVLGLVEYDGKYYSWEVIEDASGDYIELTPDNSVTGEFAHLTLNEISNGGIDDEIENISIGKFVGYYYNEDDGKWYTDKDYTTPATGILGAIAGSTTNTLENDIKEIEIGTFVDYYYNEDDGKWYTDKEFTTPATGILGAIAGSTTETLEDDIKEIEIGTFVDYYYNEDDGKWYTDKEFTTPATGILGAIAGSTTETLEEDIKEIEIGTFVDYYYNEDDGKWYTDKEFTTPATGILGAIAGSTTETLEEDIKEIPIGTFVDYYEKDGKWYTDKDCTIPATGILGAIAGSTTDTLESDIKEIEIGTFVDYYYNEDDGKWYTDKEFTTPATGILGAIAGSTTDTLEDDIKEIPIGTFVDYYEKDGKWYTDKDCTVPATGILGAIAGSTTDTLEDDIKDIPIGTFVDYYEKDGKWYTDKDCTIPATGILGAIAGSTTDTLESDIKSIKIADVLGYKKDSTGWYTVDEFDNKNYVSGIMATIADKEVGNLETVFEETLMGELLGYDQGEELPGGGYQWLENGAPVHVLMNKVANCKFDELGSLVDTLSIADLIPAEDRQSGYISLVPEDTTLNNLPNVVNKIFDETTIGELVEAEVIKLDPGKTLPAYLENLTINELISGLINGTLLTP